MATFGSWLNDQAGRQDDIGTVAMVWKQAQDRPRLSGVKSIGEWVAARVPGDVLPAERVNQALLRAGYEYREVNSGRQPLAAVPAVDAQPPGGDTATMEPSAEPGPAVMAALGRIERMLAGMWQELQPLVELARDVQASGEQAAAEQGTAEAWAGQPPAETHEAWLAEGELETGSGIAEQAMAAGVPAAVPQVPSIYGDTPAVPPAPEPDWAALAQQASPEQAG